MKRLISIAALAILLLLPALGTAVQLPQQIKIINQVQQQQPPQQQQPSPQQSCSNSIVIDKKVMSILQMVQRIQKAFDDYCSYQNGQVCEICFTALDVTKPMDELTLKSTELPPNFAGFNISIKAGDSSEVRVKGLILKNDETHPLSLPGALLLISNQGVEPGKLIIEGLSLMNIKDGVIIDGTGKIEIRNSNLTGSASTPGTCLDIKSNWAIVQGADISGCAKAILVEADDALIGAADKDHLADMNTIHDNVLGIHVVSGQMVNGQRNKFGYNLVYDNKQIQMPQGTAKDAITIEQNANESLAALEVKLFDGDDNQKYALKCTRDQANNVITREVQFQAPQQTGIATLYWADKDLSQPKKYLTTCALDAQGLCLIKDLPPEVMALIQPGDCGIKNYFMTALFTGTSSTELLSAPFEFSTKISSIIAAPVETQGPIAGATDSSGGGGDTVELVGNSMGEGGVGAGSSQVKCSLIQGAPYNPESVFTPIIALIGLLALLSFRRLSKQGIMIIQTNRCLRPEENYKRLDSSTEIRTS